MAFPTVVSVTESSFSSASTNHYVSLPARTAGELLIMLFSADDFGSVTTPSGWTVLMQVTADYGRFRVYAIEVASTAGASSVNVITNNAQPAAAQVYRISNWGGSVDDAVDIAIGGINGNPPSLNVPWGADDNLWIAAALMSSTKAATSAPSNYTGLESTSSGSGTDHAQVHSAYRQRNASSEDPGAFGGSLDSFGVLITIGVAPSGITDKTISAARGTATAAAPLPVVVRNTTIGGEVAAATAAADEPSTVTESTLTVAAAGAIAAAPVAIVLLGDSIAVQPPVASVTASVLQTAVLVNVTIAATVAQADSEALIPVIESLYLHAKAILRGGGAASARGKMSGGVVA